MCRNFLKQTGLTCYRQKLPDTFTFSDQLDGYGLAREFRLYMDFDMLAGPLSAWELYCVGMGDNVRTRAYMQFYLIYVHFHHMMSLKWIFSNVKNNPKSIGSVVF